MKKNQLAALCFLILFLVGCVTILNTMQSGTSRRVVLHVTDPQSRELHSPATNSLKNVSLEQLLSSVMFNAQKDKLQWIAERITRMSPSWNKAYSTLRAKDPSLFASPKRILVLPGLLSEYSSYDFAANAYKGGYLGELVQWSDLIAGLHMLHHNLTVVTSMDHLKSLVPLSEDSMFDLVMTDYIGLVGLRMADLFASYKCRLRVLDSFGSEPYEVFRTLNFSEKDLHDSFNIWNFESMLQFWTYFPHTPDNSFLGTVVEERQLEHRSRRSNKGLIYGKEGEVIEALRRLTYFCLLHDLFNMEYIIGREGYLNVIGEYMELHSTFKETFPSTPKHIVNDGVMSQVDVQRFLQSARLFIGLGFPYDGPGPLEALANGCPFIQPKFNPPHSGKNTAFFHGKPTRRALSSQHPYLEQFVGEPYVYTIDVTDPSALRKAVMDVLKKGDLQPFIPYELTAEGMLERIGSLILYQDFCDGENLALHKHATASSSHASHTPYEAVDGLLGHTSCWWSHLSTSSWWSLNLGWDMPIRKIRVYYAPDVLRAVEWQGSSRLAPFQISLLNSNGQEVAKKTFHDPRAVYVWDDVYVLAGSIRIESLLYLKPAYMVLCGVEVYRGVEEPPVWPALYHLKTQLSEPGASCKDTCALKRMVCEPAYFKYINTEKAVKANFKCKSVSVATQYNDYTPGVTAGNGGDAGTCLLNSDHDNFVRLCPCRRYAPGQVALPPVN